MRLDLPHRPTTIVIIAALCVFSTQFGVTVITPLLGVWVAASEAPFLVAALIFSAFTMVSTPLNIPGGMLSDRWGRKPLIVAGLSLYALASALFPFSTEPYDWIFVRAVQGAGAGLFFPAITALLSEVTNSEDRGRALGVYNIGLGLGLAVGPASGGILFDKYGLYTPFFVCVVLALLSVVLVILLVTEPEERVIQRGRQLTLREYERRPLLLAGLIIFFGIGVAAIMGALFSPYALALEHLKLSASFIGVILSFMFLVFAVLQFGLTRVMQRLGALVLALTGLVLCAGGLLILYQASSVLELVLMSVLLGAGLGAVSLGTLTLATNVSGTIEGEQEERRGKVMGIYYTIFYAGLGGIPLVCGALSELVGARVLFLGYAVLLLVVMGVVWRLRMDKNYFSG
ncbi:MAG: MFS transporter [Methanomicrobia archaeon]|nr:MFS transporter [Methanomicrobia archaeon]